jgi:hypothetical protein
MPFPLRDFPIFNGSWLVLTASPPVAAVEGRAVVYEVETEDAGTVFVALIDELGAIVPAGLASMNSVDPTNVRS